MTDRLITAPADKTSGLAFLDGIGLSSPEKRQAQREAHYAACIVAIERGDTWGFPPAMVDHCRKLMAERAAVDAKRERRAA